MKCEIQSELKSIVCVVIVLLLSIVPLQSSAQVWKLNDSTVCMDSSTFIQSVNKQSRTTAQRDTCIENLTDCTVQSKIDEFEIMPTPAFTRIFKSILSLFSNSMWLSIGLVLIFLSSISLKSQEVVLLMGEN